MVRFFKDRPVLIIVIIIAILLCLIFATSGDREVTGPESVTGAVVTPVSSFFSVVFNGVSDFFGDLFNSTDVDEENAVLKERIKQLESEAQLTNELKTENERLREIAGYIEDNEETEMITARVVGKNPGYWFDIFLINAGRNKGIQKDMPVVTPQGLVGRVMEVGNTWSKVLSVIDTRSSVSGIVERTRDNGIVRGALQVNSQEGLCQIFYLPYDNDIMPGDIVLTSGLGGIYPKGIVIGEVIEVGRQRDQVQRTATIKPRVDFLHLEEVIVITGIQEMVME